MRVIILLRHGESADKQQGQRDFDRILTERGVHSVKQLATQLFDQKLIPDCALVSPAHRTKQTAQLLLEGLSANLVPQFEMDIYNGDDETYKNLIETSGNDWQCLLLVGHNPSISALVGRLTNKSVSGLHPGQAAILKVKQSMKDSALLKMLGPFW